MKAVVDKGAISFPVIIRTAGTHTGKVIGLFDNPGDCASIAAEAEDDVVLIEFFDVRRGDGLCPKIRFFFIGEEILVRHLFLGDGWNVHGSDYGRIVRGNPELEREEELLLRGGFPALPAQVRHALQAIRQRIDLDYFGLDGAIMEDGRLIVFEANATMNFYPLSSKGRGLYKHEVCEPPARAATSRLILAKLGGTPVQPS